MLSSQILILYRALFFCLYSTIGVLFPFFTLHLRGGVGFSDREIAMIGSLAGVTILLFQQGWGYVADVLLPKKTLLFITVLGSGTLFLIVGFLTKSWMVAVAMFAFNCLFTSTNQLLHSFLFAHPGGERYFGLLRAWGSLGFVVLSIGVGYYSDHVTGGSLRFIFPLFLVLAVISCLVLIPLPETRLLPAVRPNFWEVQNFFLRNRKVVCFLVLVFVYQAAHTPSYALQALLMSDMGADRSTVAFSYSLAALLELPVFYLATRFIGRFGAPKLILGCAMLQSVRWLLVWASTTPGQLIVISLIHCLTFGLFYAAAVTYMNSHAGPLKASAQTMFALIFHGLAGVVGNVVGGQALSGGFLSPVSRFFATRVLGLPNRGDLPNLYLVCSAVAAVSVLLSIALIRVDRQPAATSPQPTT